jgi:transcriptional regulator with XRE-family HTH domain
MSFGDRLDLAITERKSSRAALATALGVTQQAISLVITGDTKAMNAGNAAKTARFLGVDYLWLATGEGVMEPQQSWPIKRVPIERFLSLSPADQAYVEGRLEEAIRDCESRSTPAPSKTPKPSRNRVVKIPMTKASSPSKKTQKR